jgi:uncharacterized protein YjbJ (UPF0337 family)
MKQSSFASGEIAMGSTADKVFGKPNQHTGKDHQSAGKAVGKDEMQVRA